MSVPEGWCGDVLETVAYERRIFEWRIPDFLSLTNCKDKCYKSQPFSFANESWNLLLYPEGKKNIDDGFVSLFLKKSSSKPVTISYTLSIKNPNGYESTSRRFSVMCATIESEMEGAAKFLNRTHLKNNQAVCLPLGTLTVTCHMALSFGSIAQDKKETLIGKF